MTPAAMQTFVLNKASGIRRAFADAGLPDGLVLHEKHVPPSDTSGIGMTNEIVLDMARWLKRGEAPSAVVDNTFRMPCVLAAAREAGLRLGHGFDVVGIGDPAPARQGEYTCINDQFDQIAREVTEMIVADTDDFDRVGRHIVVPPVLVPRWQPSREKLIEAEVSR
jgi:DNA-binding LacI/PurR family transcriptional regulator